MDDPRLAIHPEAAQEADDAQLWFERQSSRRGALFNQTLDHFAHLILDHPHLWSPTDLGCRKVQLRPFKFVLIYRPDERPIRIIAVAPGSRDPTYWHHRVFD